MPPSPSFSRLIETRAARLSLCCLVSLRRSAFLVSHFLRYRLLSCLLEDCVGKCLGFFLIALHVPSVSVFFVVTVEIAHNILKLSLSDLDFYVAL